MPSTIRIDELSPNGPELSDEELLHVAGGMRPDYQPTDKSFDPETGQQDAAFDF